MINCVDVLLLFLFKIYPYRLVKQVFVQLLALLLFVKAL